MCGRRECGVQEQELPSIEMHSMLGIRPKPGVDLNTALAHESHGNASGVFTVFAQGALQHLVDTKHEHLFLPETNRRAAPCFLLDLPLPIELDMRPRRCVFDRGNMQNSSNNSVLQILLFVFPHIQSLFFFRITKNR